MKDKQILHERNYVKIAISLIHKGGQQVNSIRKERAKWNISVNRHKESIKIHMRVSVKQKTKQVVIYDRKQIK